MKKMIIPILISILCGTLAYFIYVIVFRSRLVIRSSEQMPSVVAALIDEAQILPVEIPMRNLIVGAVARPKHNLLSKLRNWFSVSVDPIS